MNFKKLRTEPRETLKVILIKYIQSALNLTMLIAAPGPFLCVIMRLYGKVNRRSASFAWLFGSFAVFFEGLSRHVTYAGYFVPKAFEIFLNVLEHKGKISQTKFRGLIILFLASALLGIAASRGHCKKKKDLEKLQIKEEESLFDGAFGFLLN